MPDDQFALLMEPSGTPKCSQNEYRKEAGMFEQYSTISSQQIPFKAEYWNYEAHMII